VPEAETAVVKEGLGYYTCLSLSAAKAQELIEATAARAFAKAARVRPYRIEGPVTIQVEHTTRSTLFPENAAFVRWHLAVRPQGPLIPR